MTGTRISDMDVLPASAANTYLAGISGGENYRVPLSYIRTAVIATSIGAVADGVTDNYAIVQAAIDSFGSAGGWLHFPKGVYYFSDRLKITTPMRITGEMMQKRSSFTGGGMTLQDTLTGTTFKFAAGKGGIIFYSFTDSEETPATVRTSIDALGVNSPYAQYPGGNNSILSGIAFMGQGGAEAHGVEFRCQMSLFDLYIRGFSGDGIRCTASVSGSVGKYGNASLSVLRRIDCIGNTGNGFHTIGIDANVILFDSCNAQINGGVGYYDRSFLGNCYLNCHAATNTGGAWYGHPDYRLNARHVLFAPYVETGTGATISMGAVTSVYGGIGGDANYNATDNEAFAIVGGKANRRHFVHENKRTAVTVQNTLGFPDTSQTIQAFGSSDESATFDAWKFFYDSTAGQKAWSLRYAGARVFIQYSNNLDGTFRSGAANAGFGPAFPGGYYFGALPSRNQHHNAGAAAPTTGPATDGDVTWLTSVASGGYAGRIVTTAGTYGSTAVVSDFAAIA